MQRFQGFPGPRGILVLDTWTGEVVHVGFDGASATLRHGDPSRAPVVASAEPTLLAAPAPLVASQPSAGPPVPAPATSPTTSATEILSTQPYPVAAAYRAYLDEQDPRQRCKLLVDTFTSVLKLWALVAASEYLAAPSVSDPALNRLLVRDLSRPLISSWGLVLEQSLQVLAKARVAPFAPELRRAYDELERKCRDRVPVITRYVDEAGEVKERETRLGKISALVRYRNGLAHGFNQPRTKAIADLAKLEPVLHDVLRASRFLAGYPLVRLLRDADGIVRAQRLMGCELSSDAERLDVPVPSGQRYALLDERHRAVLPLHAFVEVDVVESGREALPGTGLDVLLFEGRSKNAVLYASAHGEYVEKQARTEDWKRSLASKAVEDDPAERHALDLGLLKERARLQREAVLAKLTETERFIPEAEVPRAALAEVIERLVHGDQRGLVLGGDSGTGKTFALASLASVRAGLGDVVLHYDGRSLHDAELAARVRADLGVAPPFFEDVLVALDGCIARTDHKLWILVDAVNEHADAAALVRAIDSIVSQGAAYPWLRVVATVRSSSYRRIAPYARFGDAPRARYVEGEPLLGAREVVVLPQYTDDEVLLAYGRYRDLRSRPRDDAEADPTYLHRPRTEPDALEPSSPTFGLLRNPLVHRLLMRAFHRQDLPTALQPDQVMRLYVEHVIVEREHPLGAFPERIHFLRTLVREMRSSGTDALPRERLLDLAATRAALRSGGRESPYVQLLELGVLQEEWSADDECTIRFVQRQLLEYLLAEQLDPSIDGAEALARHVHSIDALPAIRGALVTVCRRMASDGRRDELVRAFAGAADTALASILEDALVEISLTDDRVLRATVDALAIAAPATAAALLRSAFARAFAAGAPAQARVLADGAISVARSRADGRGLAEALLLRVALAAHSGSLREAARDIDEARVIAQEAGAGDTLDRVHLWSGRLAYAEGSLDVAREHYSLAYEGSASSQRWSDATEAKRWLGTIAWRRGDLAAREVLTREALEIAERCGDLGATAKALNNLAMALEDLGRIDDAEAAYQRSLEIKQRIGDRRSLATSWLNFGKFLRSKRGETTRAERCWQQSHRIHRELGNHEGISLVLTNLAISAVDRGALDEALALLGEAIPMFEERRDARGGTYALWVLANVQLAKGQGDDARRTLEALEAWGPAPAPAELQRAAVRVRLAVRSSTPAGVLEAARELERAFAATSTRDLDLEDLPIEAWREAAPALRAAAPDLAASFERHAVEALASRPWAAASAGARGPALIEA